MFFNLLERDEIQWYMLIFKWNIRTLKMLGCLCLGTLKKEELMVIHCMYVTVEEYNSKSKNILKVE
jgi:hypothetical protein